MHTKGLTDCKFFVPDLFIHVRGLHANCWKNFVAKHHDTNDAKLDNHDKLCQPRLQCTLVNAVRKSSGLGHIWHKDLAPPKTDLSCRDWVISTLYFYAREATF